MFFRFLCFVPGFGLRKRTGGRFLRAAQCRRESKPRRESGSSRRGWSATPDLTGGIALKFFLDDEMFIA
jgi:hypothetical protein